MLARYGQQFRRTVWVVQFRGYALWRLGDLEGALASFKQADSDQQSKDIANLLALAHFYIEQDDLSAAENYIHKAIGAAPRVLSANSAGRFYCGRWATNRMRSAYCGKRSR